MRWTACTACLVMTACLGSLDDADRFRDGSVAAVDLGPPGCPDVLSTILQSDTAPKGCAQASCHSMSASLGGLELESPNLIARLSDNTGSCATPWIDTVNPANSLLYTKLLSTPQTCGSRMPIGVTLTDEERACILTFIENGLSPSADAGVADLGAADLGEMTPDMGVAPTVEVEAEAMSVSAPFIVASDNTASGSAYVTQPTGTLNADPTSDMAGRMTFDFSMPGEGPARIFARIRAPSEDNDSFWVRVDMQPYVRWNDLNQVSAGNWVWDDVHDSDGDPMVAVQFNLTAGMHRLEIAFREPNAQLDRVVITQDPAFVPPQN